jgi:small subunit ribosomal protein S2
VKKNADSHECLVKEKNKMTEESLLLPTDNYLKAGIHIGTKFKTKYMEKFIYKTRPDGLSVLNLQEIDKRIGIAAKFLANYEPEEIMIVSRREGSFKALKKMKELLGLKAFAGRYPPGILTNPELENFIEAKVILASDPWADKSAVNDAFRAGITIIGCCDTNNQTNRLDLVIPCNNKGKKSLGLLFYLLTREYMVHKGLIKNAKDFQAKIEDFVEE